MDKVNMVKTKNRRGFFRVYEEAGLLFKKIDNNQLPEFQPVYDDSFDKRRSFNSDELAPTYHLPSLDENWPADTDFVANDALNVNISASGIAFLCEDPLEQGEYLAMKIKLESNSKEILTYARVVYCKTDQDSDEGYPSFVGAHFVNLKSEDQELLIAYGEKKKLRQTWLNGCFLAVILTVLAAPGAIFGLLFELIHLLLELLLEFTHLGFEFIESNLDHLIEHFFETDLHQTQVIVFYIIFCVLGVGFYRLWRKLPPFFLKLKRKQFRYWSIKKASLNFFWREQSLINKIRVIGFGVAIIALYVFFGM
ncbi:MAG: PilZ domain-containing protein [Methylobacter sp.]|nr:PilZ domain-containing protein [Methylobacter sp.]